MAKIDVPIDLMNLYMDSILDSDSKDFELVDDKYYPHVIQHLQDLDVPEDWQENMAKGILTIFKNKVISVLEKQSQHQV